MILPVVIIKIKGAKAPLKQFFICKLLEKELLMNNILLLQGSKPSCADVYSNIPHVISDMNIVSSCYLTYDLYNWMNKHNLICETQIKDGDEEIKGYYIQNYNITKVLELLYAIFKPDDIEYIAYIDKIIELFIDAYELYSMHNQSVFIYVESYE